MGPKGQRALFLADKAEELDVVVGVERVEDLEGCLEPGVPEHSLGQVLHLSAPNTQITSGSPLWESQNRNRMKKTIVYFFLPSKKGSNVNKALKIEFAEDRCYLRRSNLIGSIN